MPWKLQETTSIGVTELFAVFVPVWFDATALISTKRPRMLENHNMYSCGPCTLEITPVVRQI